MRVATVDGRRLAWREAGAGTPVLLMHCALAHSGVWGPLISLLGPALAVIAPDLPKHGGTDPAAGPSPQAEAVADARTLIFARGPAHVIGHSFGATAGLRLAIEAPTLVRSLVLIEPVMFAFLRDAGEEAAYSAEEALHEAVAGAAAAGDPEAGAERFLARWGTPGGSADLTPERRADLVARFPFIAESGPDLYDGPQRRLRLDDVERLSCPVLLLRGGRSPYPARRICELAAERLPGARLVDVEEAGHMLPLTHAAEVASAIRSFLAIPAAAASTRGA